MRRALSLWLPTWATDLTWRRIRRQASAPASPRRNAYRPVILLTQRRAAREIIVHRCLHAARFGISPDMDLSHARALVPSGARLHVEEHQAQRDDALLQRLACWALRYSPTVAADSPDGLLLDATGLERLYPSAGEAGLSRAIGEALVRRGFAVRIAVAETYAAARAIARYGTQAVAHVPPGGDRGALASLPAAALCVDAQMATAFHEVGVSNLGHLFALPRASLASQFGAELLRRVDRALGLAPEVIDAVHPPAPFRTERLFEGPIDRWETLEAATRDVLERMVAMLRLRSLGARQLELQVLRPAPEAAQLCRIRLSRHSASRTHLWAMLRAALDRVDVGAGIEGVVLTATAVGRLVSHQGSLGAFAPQHPSRDCAEWGEIVDTLVSRLGEENVLRFEPAESHLPECAFRARFATEETPARSAAAITPADRPTRLFTPSIPARAILRTPDGPLLQITWRGRQQNVIRCIGPERIGAEWWRAAPATTPSAATSDRDYFAVNTADGAWLWVGRCVDTNQWFVQGDWA